MLTLFTERVPIRFAGVIPGAFTVQEVRCKIFKKFHRILYYSISNAAYAFFLIFV